MSFNKKEDRENIEKINKTFGTNHRSAPYDLKRPGDLVEAVTMATAEYINMANFWFRLVSVRDEFDESLERFRPAAWIMMNLKGEWDDEDIEETKLNLDSAGQGLHSLMCRAEEKCVAMWRVVFDSSDSYVLEHFFGEAIKVDKDASEKVLSGSLFNILKNIEYDGVAEHSVKSFAGELKKLLTINKENEQNRDVVCKKQSHDTRKGNTINLSEYYSKMNRSI